MDIGSAVVKHLKPLWLAYEAFVAPFYPFIQWGIAIGALLLLLGWGARKLGPTFHHCPGCGRVIPRKWNPCKMCGYTFDRPTGSAGVGPV